MVCSGWRHRLERCYRTPTSLYNTNVLRDVLDSHIVKPGFFTLTNPRTRAASSLRRTKVRWPRSLRLHRCRSTRSAVWQPDIRKTLRFTCSRAGWVSYASFLRVDVLMVLLPCDLFLLLSNHGSLKDAKFLNSLGMRTSSCQLIVIFEYVWVAYEWAYCTKFEKETNSFGCARAGTMQVQFGVTQDLSRSPVILTMDLLRSFR